MIAWTNFFIAAAGASASLAGLVFVALSVNINRILEYPQLPSRAAATIGALMLILICSMATLIPQPALALGIEILAFSICGWVLKAWSAYRAIVEGARTQRPVREAVTETLLGQIQVLPFIVGGVLLIRGDAAGFYWVAGGALTVFVFSVFNGWVLLVEILR
jgi:modulator of FtsH protease